MRAQRRDVLGLIAASFLTVPARAVSRDKNSATYDALARSSSFLFWHENTMILPVLVEGVGAFALLDTGAAISIIGEELARSAGISKTAGVYSLMTPSGRVNAAGANDVAIQVAGAKAVLSSAAVMDLAHLSAAVGRPITCVIGRDFLTGFVVDVDFERRRIIAASRESYDPPVGFSAVPLKLSEDNVWTTSISIEGMPPIEAMVDTGSSTPLLLDRSYADKSVLSIRRGSTQLSAVGGTITEAKVITVSALRIGSRTLTSIPAMIYDGWALGEIRAAIGLPLLASGRLILDLAANRMWIREASSPTPFVKKDRSGLGIVAQRDRLIVVHVAPGSPAATQGWRKGDIIVQINGRRIEDNYHTGDLWRWRFGPPGRSLRLTLGDGTVRILGLRDYF